MLAHLHPRHHEISVCGSLCSMYRGRCASCHASHNSVCFRACPMGRLIPRDFETVMGENELKHMDKNNIRICSACSRGCYRAKERRAAQETLRRVLLARSHEPRRTNASILDTTKQRIRSFWLQNTSPCPFRTLKDRFNPKQRIPVHFQDQTIRSLHERLKKEKGIIVSYATFRRLRPRSIRKQPLYSYACPYCVLGKSTKRFTLEEHQGTKESQRSAFIRQQNELWPNEVLAILDYASGYPLPQRRVLSQSEFLHQKVSHCPTASVWWGGVDHSTISISLPLWGRQTRPRMQKPAFNNCSASRWFGLPPTFSCGPMGAATISRTDS